MIGLCWKGHTLNVVHCIRVWRFVVVDHLDDLQQIVFAEFLESVCEFVHVHLLPQVRREKMFFWAKQGCNTYILLSLLLLLRTLLTSSSALRLDAILITRNRTGFS